MILTNKRKIYFIGDRINRHSIISVSAIIENSKYGKNFVLEFYNFDDNFSTIEDNSFIFFSFFSGQLPQVYNILLKLKSRLSNIVAIAGGPHPSGAPFLTLKLGFDFVIKGEGEISIPIFLGALLGDKDFKDVPGLAYRNGDNFVLNDMPPPVDLDNTYSCSKSFGSCFPSEITRGCFFACKFCQVSKLFGVIPRHKSVEKILETIKKGQKYVRFVSPNAFSYGATKGKKINYTEIVRLLEGIKRIDKNIEIFFGSFPSEVRPEYINEDTLRILKEYTNNKVVAIGAQSGSNRMLKYIHRGHTKEDVYNAVELIHKAGLKAKVDFIFGLPSETSEDIKETLDFIEKIVKFNCEVRIHTFIPLVGTEFQNEKPGFIDPKVKKILMKLIGKGVASGPWLQKNQINKNLIKFYKEVNV